MNLINIFTPTNPMKKKCMTYCIDEDICIKTFLNNNNVLYVPDHNLDHFEYWTNILSYTIINAGEIILSKKMMNKINEDSDVIKWLNFKLFFYRYKKKDSDHVCTRIVLDRYLSEAIMIEKNNGEFAFNVDISNNNKIRFGILTNTIENIVKELQIKEIAGYNYD